MHWARISAASTSATIRWRWPARGWSSWSKRSASSPPTFSSPTRTATPSTRTTRSPSTRSSAPARWPPAPGVASAFPTIKPPRFFLFEPHQPELCNFTPSVFLDITPVFERKVAAMAEMRSQGYLQTYYAQRAEQRGNHARRVSGDSEIRQAEAFMRVVPNAVAEL